ncbi:MAG: hypothetical protein HOP13_20115 [Alphaproteobacteria bacterium]|nr:hypothetical protein [Alphaproteobacteria bacterium]
MQLWRLAVVVTTLFVAASAWSQADGTSQWTLHNDSDEDVLVSFYERGAGDERQQGALEAGKTQTYKLSCKAGQRICYGAVVADEYDAWFDAQESPDEELEDGIPEPEGWGVRLGKDQCTDCCAKCGSAPRTVNLRN